MKKEEKQIILFVTSFPPTECGIATFSQDLIESLKGGFSGNYDFQVCSIVSSGEETPWDNMGYNQINTRNWASIQSVAKSINCDKRIAAVCIQHEFGLWGGTFGDNILAFVHQVQKPIITSFHTVLPDPKFKRKFVVSTIAAESTYVIVMTRSSAEILNQYGVDNDKIKIIPHGTHPIAWSGQKRLKKKYGYGKKLILSTFGLLGPNKNIETTLKAIPDIARAFPKIKYLILGRTHPVIVKTEGEKYREFLQNLIHDLGIEDYVEFVNKYLSLPELLEYLKLTDIYVFSSKDRYQAVSGTFSYAMACGCPVISTPIPHAKEMLDDKSGIFFDFESPSSLIQATKKLLSDKKKLKDMAQHAYQITRETSWYNVAIKYNDLLQQTIPTRPNAYNYPPISVKHIERMTDDFAMIQFSKMNSPDISSGYTIDDNARALVAILMHYKQSEKTRALKLISQYVNFISYCQQENGRFQNYVDKERNFHRQNEYVNLDDSNARAIWALGYVIQNERFLPLAIVIKAQHCIEEAEAWLMHIPSPRAKAFVIKGLYFYHCGRPSQKVALVIDKLAGELIELFNQVSKPDWVWFENYLTYANGIMPEALLYAYEITKKAVYKNVAVKTLDFLLSKTLHDSHIRIISSRGWLHKGGEHDGESEQPIDVTYTIFALEAAYKVIGKERYKDLMTLFFSWFLGNNRLHFMVYDPLTGGCHDGLEKSMVNLNQGAESTVCYLLARLTMEKYMHKEDQRKPAQKYIPSKTKFSEVKEAMTGKVISGK